MRADRVRLLSVHLKRDAVKMTPADHTDFYISNETFSSCAAVALLT